MKRKRDMERESLEWKERLFELRKKYRDTPPGFLNEAEEKACLEHL